MRSKGVIYTVCLIGALAAVACGTEDDSTPGASGAGGKGNAGSSGRAGNAGGGKSGAGGSSAGNSPGGNSNIGGNSPGEGGEGGEAGTGANTGCTNFTALVHDVIKNDTNAKSVPRPVNGVVFCPDPADPAAYNDLF